jgi:hypothetical protein
VKKIHTIIINITLCKMFLQKFKRKLQLKKRKKFLLGTQKESAN